MQETQIETRVAVANGFRLGHQREAGSRSLEGHVKSVPMFLYVIQKGEVHNGKPKHVGELNVNVPETRGRNPGKSAQDVALTMVTETC